jgi:hypothetical protein
MCSRFYLFEPICTAILLAVCSGASATPRRHDNKQLIPPSVVHVIRLYGIYEQDRKIIFGLGALTAVQIVVDAVCCAFYTCASISHWIFFLISAWLLSATSPPSVQSYLFARHRGALRALGTRGWASIGSPQHSRTRPRCVLPPIQNAIAPFLIRFLSSRSRCSAQRSPFRANPLTTGT